MGKIIVIPNSNFSRNRIAKVDITKQVENSMNSQNPTSYSSSIVYVNNNSSLKNNE